MDRLKTMMKNNKRKRKYVCYINPCLYVCNMEHKLSGAAGDHTMFRYGAACMRMLKDFLIGKGTLGTPTTYVSDSECI